jgi:UV DNA damage repair endonuclease
MRIGYPCTNLTIGVMTGLFPDRHHTPEEVEAAAVENLACLARTLEFNEKADLSLFAISPRLIPYPAAAYAKYLAAIGAYVREKEMRIVACPAGPSLTPERRAAGLVHLASLLDAMDLDMTAKIPVWIGGRRGADEVARSFLRDYDALPDAVTRRLVIRNDRFHTVDDCRAVGHECGVPVAYDHHQAAGDPGEAVRACARTWKKDDGVPIVFYGSLDPGVPRPPSVDPTAFGSFLAATAPVDIDVMLLFRDRERSALLAHRVADRQRVMSAPAHQTP